MNFKNNLFGILLAIISFGVHAVAFDDGLHIGLSGDVLQDGTRSYKSTDVEDNWTSTDKSTQDLDGDLTIGGRIGYDKLFALGEHKFVLGVEVAGSAGGPQGSVTDNWGGTYFEEKYDEAGYWIGGDEVEYSTESKTKNEMDLSGELTMKVGYLPFDNIMFFAFGGLSIAHATETTKTASTHVYTDLFYGDSRTEETSSKTSFGQFGLGYVVGGGIEWMAWQNVSLRGEAFYRHLSFESFNDSGEGYDEGMPYTFKYREGAEMSGVVARLSVNYRF